MKHLFNLLGVMVVVIASLFTITSCNDDNPATPADPTISVTTAVNEAAPGGKLTISIATTAPGTLKSVTVDDAEVKTYTSGSADAFTYDYTIPTAAALGKKTLTFKVTDVNSKTATTTLDVVVGKEVVIIDKAISASTTWSASKKYLLKANIYVQAPAELTIEAGTVIKGDKVSKGALIINRGAKIHAKGTEANPIIFTSSAPANFRNYGDWGGLVLLGFANNNQGGTVTIEGVSGSEGSEDGKHGNKDNGSHEDDNSGELQYVRVEFAGIALSTDNELNGVTMGSVGNKTTIDHVQVSYSGDDSFEWFGGTVNAKYLIAYRGWDDDFDTDNGYSGHVQFGVSHRDPNIADKSGSNGFESDNDAAGDAKTPITSAKFSNMTWFGPGVYAKLKDGKLNKSNYNQNFQYGAHIRRNTAVQIYNTIFVGSYLEGIHFQDANADAHVAGCYFGRMAINVTNTPIVKISGAAYDASYFDAANSVEASQATIDLSAKIAGLGTTDKSVDTPLSLLASSSALIGSDLVVDLTANNFSAADYIGAFDGSTDWTKQAWVNFAPNATEY